MELEAAAGSVRVERFATVSIFKHLFNEVSIWKDVKPLVPTIADVTLLVKLLLNLKDLLLKAELVDMLPTHHVEIFFGSYFAVHTHGDVGHHQNILLHLLLFWIPTFLALPALTLATTLSEQPQLPVFINR